MEHWIIETIISLHIKKPRNLSRLASYLIQHNIPFEFITKGKEIKIPIENVHIESE